VAHDVSNGHRGRAGDTGQAVDQHWTVGFTDFICLFYLKK
jgi:hypothetical protein